MTDFNSSGSQMPVQPIEKPTSVTVFGVLNCVFGGMGLLCTPFSIFGMVAAGKTMEMAPSYKIFLLVSSFIGIGFSIWLLALGVGLLTFKNWARRGSVIYAWITIVWGITAFGLNILALSCGWITPPEGGMPGYIGGTVGGMCGGLIYPVLLLIFMQTARVKQAFQARGQSA
jgi:hypothetical protein